MHKMLLSVGYWHIPIKSLFIFMEKILLRFRVRLNKGQFTSGFHQTSRLKKKTVSYNSQENVYSH